MKTIKVITFLVVAISSYATYAQESKKHEVKIGLGLPSSSLIFKNSIKSADLGKDFRISQGFNKLESDFKSGTGTLYLAYNHSVSERFQLGLFVSYEQIKDDIVERQLVSDRKNLLGKREQEHGTIAIEANYKYLNKDWFKLYSGLGLGFTNVKEDFRSSANSSAVSYKKNENLINFHVTALGVRFGKRLGVSLEAGYGYKGIGNVGISYQF
ncbi:hypothetical protein ACFSTE_19860 [Aquimarina hainanensis]|uniref:Outer membrane protein beta-barrel domain-containing protein n=1 Tax=Aquimarina hainanensis TaxID=1578017 RepID=A0ABW5NDJ9_9FLAO